MKKLIQLILILILSLFCGPKSEKVERLTKDGVEVIINHLEPYEIEGEQSKLVLEEEFRIDTENDDVAKTGLTDIFDFIVDAEGHIYFDNYKNPEKMIHKFDCNGHYSLSFGKKGQGPGEFEVIVLLGFSPENELIASDAVKNRMIYFNKQGVLLKESPFKNPNSIFEIPLKNGNSFVYYMEIDFDSEYPVERVLSLFNSNWEKIKEFDRQKDTMKAEKINGVQTEPIRHISSSHIYLGTRKGTYAIDVYDFEGILLRKIMKEYQSVRVSEPYKTATLHTYEDPERRRKVYFPGNFPAFQYMFTDDAGRLYVMTYEKGKIPGEYLHDIFNSSGQFIGRTSLANYSSQSERRWAPLPVKSKNNRLYCLTEKENGYKELVVYKMSWND